MFEPLVIIGAPRSGTNILRDMLVELPSTGTWPCDEINYIWRHGNAGYPSDEFSAEMATPKISSYIRKQFASIAKKRGLHYVVEKTCANSLRAGFVNRVLPEARYVFIVRDGMDVVGSAMKRWQARFDLRYILRKARYVPPGDLPYYATRYLVNHTYRLFSRENRLAYWGPAINDLGELLARHSLPEICALQWCACVENAERDFAAMPDDKVHRMKYENFVDNPIVEFERLGDFLGRSVPAEVKQRLRDRVRPDSVGKGRITLGKDGVDALRPFIADTLARYNYE